jgi:hypothetical protein
MVEPRGLRPTPQERVAIYARVQVQLPQWGIVQSPVDCEGHSLVQAAVHDHDMLGPILRQAQRLVHQMLLWYRFAPTHADVGRHHHLRLGVVDTSGQAG